MGRAHTPAASKSSAVPTQVSTTTPDKALKKLRVFDSKQDLHEKRALSFDSQEPEATYEGEKKALPEPKAAIPSPGEQEGHSPGLGQTGEAPEMSEEVANLRELYHKTLTEKAELENMVQKLEQQIHSLTFHDEDGQGGTQTLTPASDDAARKRLQRICARNSCGTHGYDRIHPTNHLQFWALKQCYPTHVSCRVERITSFPKWTSINLLIRFI